MTFFLTFLTSLAVTFSVLPRFTNIASRIGLIDHPGGRKVHRKPKPLVGGIAMTMGVAISGLLFIPLTHLRGYWAGTVLLVLTGFLDDFREMSHRWRFLVQIAASLFLIYFSQTMLVTFGNLFSFGPVAFNSLGIPLTVFCTVGVINALNMIDGLDGLAGGVSLIAFISFGILAFLNGQTELLLLCIAFSGAVFAFLRYNWLPSTLFMGDAGSMLIGFSLAFLSIAVTQKSGSLVPPVAPLLILAVPVVDAVAVMTKRIFRGQSPFYADRGHIHHKLLLLGHCKKSAIRIIFVLTAISSSVAVLGTILRVPDYYLFLVFSLCTIVHLLFSFNIKRLLIHKASGIGEPLSLPYRAIDNPIVFSRIDHITGLLNRKALLQNLESEIEIARGHNANLSIVLCDVCHSEKNQDSFDSSAGGKIINRFATLLRESVRMTDIAGRYDTNRFMIILPDTSPSGAMMVIEKIKSSLSKMDFEINGQGPVPIALSLGSASLNGSRQDAVTMVQYAEKDIETSRNSVGRIGETRAFA